MKRASCLLSAIALFGIIGGARAALAQSEPVRIVQASDGTVFLLKDGSRYAIVGDEVSDDEVGAYADAGSISGSELLAALAPSTPRAAAVVAVASADDASARAAPGD